MVAVELTAGDSIDVAVTNTAGDTVSVTVTGHESYLGVKYHDTEYCVYFTSVPSGQEVRK